MLLFSILWQKQASIQMFIYSRKKEVLKPNDFQVLFNTEFV